jgi:predicted permease
VAIFGVADRLLFRPPPAVDRPHELVDLGRTDEGSGWDNVSYLNYLDYRDRNTVLSGLAAHSWRARPISLRGDDGAERIYSSLVSGNYFDVLGVRPALGRFFLPDEDRIGGQPVVVLSHELWRERFAGDPSIIGRGLLLNGRPFAVVGVAPEDFQGTGMERVGAWVPLVASEKLLEYGGLLEQRRAVWLQMVGRLKPGVSLDRARAEMSTIALQLAEAYPEANAGQGVALARSTRFPGEMGEEVRGFMALLFFVVGLILLIACVNVSGMMLAQAASRRREVAVRLALGASRGRPLQLWLVESLLLFALGGVGGLVLAGWVGSLLPSLLPALPATLDLAPRIDLRVLGFAAVLSLAAAFVSGLVPALDSSRPEVVGARKDDAGRSGFRRARLRSLLVVGQVALSLLLLIGAGLFVRALQRADSVDPGFNPQGVHFADLNLFLGGYGEADGARFWPELLARVEALPGLRSVALAADLPLDHGGLGLGGLNVPGKSAARGANFVLRRLERRHPGLLPDPGDSVGARARLHRRGSTGRPRGRDHQRDHGPAVLAGRRSGRKAILRR